MAKHALALLLAVACSTSCVHTAKPATAAPNAATELVFTACQEKVGTEGANFCAGFMTGMGMANRYLDRHGLKPLWCPSDWNDNERMKPLFVEAAKKDAAVLEEEIDDVIVSLMMVHFPCDKR